MYAVYKVLPWYVASLNDSGHSVIWKTYTIYTHTAAAFMTARAGLWQDLPAGILSFV